jgi:hypothetical protein
MPLSVLVGQPFDCAAIVADEYGPSCAPVRSRDGRPIDCVQVMQRILIELDPNGGWTIRAGAGPFVRVRVATRYVAECLAREQAHGPEAEIVIHDAYHRVLDARPAGAPPVRDTALEKP